MWPGPRPTSLPKWHLEPSSHFCEKDMGRKLGELCPFGEGAVSPSSAMWPGPRPTCVPSFILIRPTVWPQYSNVTDRQDKQIVRTTQRSNSRARTVFGRPFVQVLSSIAEMGDRLATIDMGRNGRKWLHLIQCGLGRGLPSYQVAS